MRPTHRSHSRLPRVVVAVFAAAPLLALAACGGNSPVAEDTPTPTVSTSTSTPTPPPTPTPTPTRTRTTKSADPNGNGDADEPTKPATAGGGICAKLSASDVGGILGGTVTGAALDGATGCTFVQADQRAPSVTITDVAFTTGGMTKAKNDATSAVEGSPENIPGIGTEAFVVTGSMFGGPDVQGAGAVHLGHRVISVELQQRKGLTGPRVRDLVIQVLRLIARQG